MDDSKDYILVAKKEFTTLLVYNLYPGIYQGVKSIWEDSKKTTSPKHVYQNFQERLSRVRKWNNDIITGEFQRVSKMIKGEWSLDELVKKIFVINTQILAAVNLTQNSNRQIRVKVPKGEKFLHSCYKEVARAFYENPLLMEDRTGCISRIEMSRNLQDSYSVIMRCIETTVLQSLPLDSILRDTYEDGEGGVDATPSYNMYKNNRPVTVTPNFIQIRNQEQQQTLLPIQPLPGSMDLNIPGSSYANGVKIQQVSPEIQQPIVQAAISVPVPAISVPVPAISVPVPAISVPAPAISVPVPSISVPVPTISVPVPVQTYRTFDDTLSIIDTVKTDLKLDLHVLSLNDDQPQISEAPDLPDLNGFDSKSFFSDMSSIA